MTDHTGRVLTAAERAQLDTGELDAVGHRALDRDVGYRVRLLAAHPDRIDISSVVADTRLLADHGHNATVSLVTGRLGEYLPTDDLP